MFLSAVSVRPNGGGVEMLPHWPVGVVVVVLAVVGLFVVNAVVLFAVDMLFD